MKLELTGRLDDMRDTTTDVGRIVSSQRYAEDRRTVFVMGLLATMTEHHRSVLQLIKSGAIGSSYALTRDIVRAMRYGLWMICRATPEQIDLIETSDDFPMSIQEMTKEIEAAYATDPFFQGLKNRWGAQLYQYTLSDVVQIGRWNIDERSGLHHDDEEIRSVATIATLCIVLLAAKFLESHKHTLECKQVENLATIYTS